MKRLAIGCVLLSLVSGCATNSDLEATRQQITQVNQQASARLSQIETKLSNDKLLDMVSQLDDLRAQVAKLSGQVEVLNYNLQSTQKRQNDLYTDLDGRLTKLETPASAAASSAPAASAPPAGASAQTVPDYDRALNLLRQRNFADAIPALSQYIKQNPDSPQAVDALFWIGVAHTALKQYDAAIAIHRQFVTQNPNHPKAPDAMRNIASCQIELSQNDEAKVTLKRLIKLYPKSAAATKAKAMLKSL